MDGPADTLPTLETIDLYDPSRYSAASQHPAWAALRREAPVWQQRTPDGTPFWSLTRYSDAEAVLKDTERFSSESGTLLAVIGGDAAGGSTILLTDPPAHTFIKGPVAKLMSRHTAPSQIQRIRDNVRRLVEPCLDGGRHDFAQLMSVLPMAAAGETLGIPSEYWQDVATWTMTGLAPEDPAFATGNASQTLRAAHHQLFALFAELVEHRRKHPADDLITALLQLNFVDRSMTTEEVLLNCYTFAMGTNSTTPHVAGHMLLALLDSPSAWRTLKDEPGLLPNAVEEVCRWATPTNHLMRRTTVDVELHGTTVPEGAAVCVWLASANRDESVFRDPYVFDPARRPNPHIAFGLGTHYCTGARAARLVLETLLEELVMKFDRFESDGEPRHLRSNFVNGMSSLPVVAYPVRGPSNAGRDDAVASMRGETP